MAPVAVIEVDAQVAILDRRVAGAEAGDHPSAREMVHRGDLVRQPERVMEGRHVHRVADGDPFGAGGDGGRDHRGRRRQTVGRTVMLGQPHAVEPQVLGQYGVVQRAGKYLGLRHARRLRQDEKQPEAHAQSYTVAPRGGAPGAPGGPGAPPLGTSAPVW